MMLMTRSHRMMSIVALVCLIVALGIGLAPWIQASGHTVTRVAGVALVAGGFLLLTSRRLFKDSDGPRTAVQRAAKLQMQRHFRVMGASAILMGVAQFIPDMPIRTAVILCGAGVSMAGVFRVPRRLFLPSDDIR